MKTKGIVLIPYNWLINGYLSYDEFTVYSVMENNEYEKSGY